MTVQAQPLQEEGGTDERRGAGERRMIQCDAGSDVALCEGARLFFESIHRAFSQMCGVGAIECAATGYLQE